MREEGLRYGRGADGAGVAQKHAVGQRDGVHEQEGQEVLDARVVRLRVQPLQQRALHALPIEPAPAHNHDDVSTAFCVVVVVVVVAYRSEVSDWRALRANLMASARTS